MAKKILVIDDSALMRRVISDIINEGNEYEVAAIAKDGVQGFDLIVSNPNLYSAVILDINMPKMNGLELLKELQKNHIEQTVIVVSTVAKEGAKETIQALEYGAFDFVTKPENYLETKGAAFKEAIHKMLDVATNSKSSLERTRSTRNLTPISSKTRVQVTNATQKNKNEAQFRPAATVRDRNSAISALRKRSIENNAAPDKIDVSTYKNIKSHKKKIVALACSTGGPKSLQQVIPVLPKNLDSGVVVVQHMPAGFTASLAQRLNEMSEIRVKEAEHGEIIKKGVVYIAPGGQHLKIVKSGSEYKIELNREPAIDGLRPCANIMYQSLENSDFDEITCVVLTGMGADGTKGIKGLAAKKKNIHVIAQDEDSCVVYGMPKAIAQTGLVDEVVALNHIASSITKNVGVI
jgi:two-component system, chemotaxis family, protein-glutamate methylesterase/glutaminase